METNTEQGRFYYPELDGLRFFAFLLVFIHNLNYVETSMIWKALNKLGWIGVDLFFCLSAFLLTKLLSTEYEQRGRIYMKDFLFRRALRIWPLYFFYLALAFLFTVWTDDWGENASFQVIGLMTFTYNFVYIAIFPYVLSLFFHLWTVSFEAQFYVVIPYVVRALVQIPKKKRMIWILGALLSGNIVRAAFILLEVKHPAIYMLPFTRFDAILGGILLGLGMLEGRQNKFRAVLFLSLGILIAIGISLMPEIYNIGWHLMAVYSLTGASVTLVVLAVIDGLTTLISNVLANKIIVYLGRISYGLYVFHPLCSNVASRIVAFVLREPVPNIMIYRLLVFFFSLILTILFASLSYHFIEDYFLRLKERFTIVPSHPV